MGLEARKKDNSMPPNKYLLFLLLLTSFSRGFEENLIYAPPAGQLERMELAPGRNFESFVFDTIPGINYTVESSTDLSNWQPYGPTHYGLGQQVVIPFMEHIPAATAPPAPAGEPTLWPQPVSMLLFKAIGGGIIIHFRSTEQSTSVLHHYPDLNLSSDWNTTPLHITNLASGYFFLIANANRTVSPPLSPVPLSNSDSAIISAFGSNFSAIDLEVQGNAGPSRLMPPPLDLDTNVKCFFRVNSDPDLDTDSDGTPDWLEFADASSPSGGLSSNPFVGDTNDNGVPDGQELDSDSDGASNSQDAAPSDPLVEWQPNDPFLFAFFPLIGTGNPLQVNDRGQVLFEKSLWTAGQQLQLLEDGETLNNCYPLGFNDSGRIIGIGTVDFPGDSIVGADICLVTWPATGGAPSALRFGDKYLVPISLPTNNPRVVTFPPPSDMTINSDGQFIAFTATPELGPGPEGPDSLYSLVIDAGGAKVWQTGAGGGITEVGEAPPFMAWKSDTGAFIGADETGKFKIGTKSFSEPYTKAAIIPGGKLAALASQEVSNASIAPSWGSSSALGDAIDVSEEGRFVLRKHWEVWHNGEKFLRLGYERAPGLIGWNDVLTCSFMDTTKHGWTLATKGKISPLPILGLPLFLSTTQIGHGVDTQSAMGSDSPSHSLEMRKGNKDEFWVMVPAGGSTQMRVRSAASSTTQVSIIPSGGIISSPAVLSSSEAAVTLSAPLSTAEQESNIHFKIGSIGAASHPLRAKVMKSRTVNVSVWPLKRPGVPLGNPPSNPPPLPSEQEFEEALNNIFEPQINCRFNITIQSESSLPENSWSSFPVDNPPNATQTNIAATKTGAHIHVFTLGGVQSLTSGFTYDGWTNPTEGWVWLSTHNLVGGNEDQKEKWLHVLGHEVGHVLLGGGHPDNLASPGRAGLPFTNRDIRLMHSGTGVNSTGRRLLVKAEWDEAESWLVRKIDSTDPEQ